MTAVGDRYYVGRCQDGEYGIFDRDTGLLKERRPTVYAAIERVDELLGRLAPDEDSLEAEIAAAAEAHGHVELNALVEDVTGSGPLKVAFREELAPANQRLMDSMGVEVEIDPDAPASCEHEEEAMETVTAVRARGGKTWTKDKIIEAIVAHADLHDGEPPASRDWVNGSPSHPSLYNVKAIFGSWADAVEAAGFARPKRGGANNRKKNGTAPAAAARRAVRAAKPQPKVETPPDAAGRTAESADRTAEPTGGGADALPQPFAAITGTLTAGAEDLRQIAADIEKLDAMRAELVARFKAKAQELAEFA
jgi:hypothetical protein